MTTVRFALRALLFCSITLTIAVAQQKSIEDELYTYVLGIEGQSHAGRGEFVKAQLKRIGIATMSIPFTDIAIRGRDTIRTTGENIVARIGRGPKKIVLGAHYDAVEGSPGANDNGGGVSVLLALARTFRLAEWNCTIELCFFDHEEDGLIGSNQYAERFVDRRTHKAMINLDVVGTGDEIYIGPVGGGDDLLLMPLARKAAAANGVRIVEKREYPDSDQESFMKRGLENISISIVPQGDGDRLSKMVRGEIRSREDVPKVLGVMHTPNDSSREVSPEALKLCFEFVKTLVGLVDQTK